MLQLAPEINAEYLKWLERVENDDPYESPICLGLKDVLKAHFLIADHFFREGRNLGGLGPRDINLLHSALYRQYTAYGGVVKYEDKFETCATLFFGLIKDHPFYDANKRTAFLCMLFQLQKIGHYPTVSKKVLEDFTVEIADSQLEKYARFQDLKKAGLDPNVGFISWFLRHNTRRIDKRQHAVTFSDLNQILKRFGYEFGPPKGNYIDVVRVETRRKIFGFGGKEVIGVKVCQVGFPGMTKQVSPAAIRTIRKAAKLDEKHGVDSAAFFRDADPISFLIAEYQDPLQQLATR